MIRVFTVALSVTACTGYAEDPPTWGLKVMPPSGWVRYCVENPTDTLCGNVALRTVGMQITYDILSSMHTDVRKGWKYISDREQYGVEDVWDIPENMKGDCEDYVLTMRRRLIKRYGCTDSNCYPALAWVNGREGRVYHMVLVVELSDGTKWVADSKLPALLPFSWDPTMYVWDRAWDGSTKSWRKLVRPVEIEEG